MALSVCLSVCLSDVNAAAAETRVEHTDHGSAARGGRAGRGWATDTRSTAALMYVPRLRWGQVSVYPVVLCIIPQEFSCNLHTHSAQPAVR